MDKKKKAIGFDPVNNPKHYTKGSVECFDAIFASQGMKAAESFCLCNAFKYIWRCMEKNGVEDVKKAIWYLQRYIDIESGTYPEGK